MKIAIELGLLCFSWLLKEAASRLQSENNNKVQSHVPLRNVEDVTNRMLEEVSLLYGFCVKKEIFFLDQHLLICAYLCF